MIAECTYRLSPRRYLHELFFEVKFDALYQETSKLLQGMLQIDSGKSPGDSEGPQTSNIKKLDTIKLAYKENKFPIRNRNESKIV